jgi:FkbH-like protein
VSRKQLLKESALERLATLLAAVEAAARSDAPWRAEARIHFLRNYTTEPLDPYLRFHLMREDLRPTITHGGYGTVAQELLDPESDVSKTPPDILVLSQLVEFLDPAATRDGWTADVAIAELTALLKTLVDQSSALVVANTFIAPINRLMEDPDPAIRGEIRRLNDKLRSFVEENTDRIVICDWSEASAGISTADLVDTRFWRSSQAPFRTVFLDRYARQIASYVRAGKGLTKKLLILDCDNTLWGGVVGEEGHSGIQLGPDSRPGEYYYRVQQLIVDLHQRGVMIALCSKNNEEDVWQVFDEHPHAVLQKSHLVAWRINWDDKAQNIGSIVRELNIGMDSVVFIDDNPRELALIAEQLPDITLLAVPEDLSLYERKIVQDGWFNSVSRSEEDKRRTRMYRDEHARSEQKQRFRCLDGYLRSLETVARIGPVGEAEISRAAQLTQKTNQFNLTTRRYSEADIRGFVADADSAVFIMAVSDRFGDMGNTGLFIARRDGASAIIDTFLLSCRILGRRLELAFADQCMRSIEEHWKVCEWRAEYIATRKNRQTEHFWEMVGFRSVGEDSAAKLYISGIGSRIVDYQEIITVEWK